MRALFYLILFIAPKLHADTAQICLNQWFEDRDNDGFGNPDVWTMNCNQPVGYVAARGDCNDDPNRRGTIFHPGAKEPCNYDDYNCDGKVKTCPEIPLPKKTATQKDVFVLSSFPSGSVTTDGRGNPKVMQSLGLSPADFTGLMPKLWLKIDNIKNVSDLSLFLGNKRFKNYVHFRLSSSQGQQWITEGDWVALPVAWDQGIISQQRLEPGLTLDDLRKNITDIKIQVRDNQKAPVTLEISKISAVSEGSEKYPKGVISITFDDGWESLHSIAKPKLETYGFAATVYTIVGFLDIPNFLTTAQLYDLQSANWEISFHAFDPVMHLISYTNFPEDMVERDILAGRQWLWENGFGGGYLQGKGIAHFAYPKGEFKQPGKTDVLQIARSYFSSARSINERQQESLLPADAHKLRVLYVTAPEDVQSIISRIAAASAAGEWIILVFHDLVEHPVSNDQWAIDKFNLLIDAISLKFKDVPVRTVGEVLSSI